METQTTGVGELGARLAKLDCIDETHRAIAAEALSWIVEQRVYVDRWGQPDVEESARRALIASTFAYFCSPPDATESRASHVSGNPLCGYYLAAQFVFLFLIIDESSSAAECACYRDLVRAFINGEEIHVDEVRAQTVLQFLRNLRQYSNDMSPFLGRLNEFCAYSVAELEVSRAAIDLAKFAELREVLIAVTIYSALWEAIGGLVLSRDERELALPLHRKACELQWIANDLGSLARDSGQWVQASRDREDVNLVLVLAREQGLSIQAARERVVRRHNQLVGEFDDEYRRRCLVADGDLRRYLDGIPRSVNGNRAATIYLNSVRFSAEPALALLCQVREPMNQFVPEGSSEMREVDRGRMHRLGDVPRSA